MADGANAPLQGSDANRKPDLVLLPADIAESSRPLDWRDVSAIGEMKTNKTSNTVKSSYIEAAGKTALLLYAQDGRHSTPCVRLLGHHIILTFFDRGGSLSTAPMSTHLLRTLLSHIKVPSYHVHVLSRLLTEPLGQRIFDFSSLAELLVVFIDYVLSRHNVYFAYRLLTLRSVHKNAVEKARILHRDMSLLNFLLVQWNRSDAEYSWDFVHSSHLSPEAQESLL